MNKVLEKINGKKLPITMVLAIGLSYGTLQAQVKSNADHIDDLKPNTEQIARIDERVQSMDKRVERLDGRVEKGFDRLGDKMDKLIQAVMR